MQEQRFDSTHLIYDLVLQEAHEVSHQCLERLHHLNSRFKCPDEEQVRNVELNWTNRDAQAQEDLPI